jgi:hypothetical protein
MYIFVILSAREYSSVIPVHPVSFFSIYSGATPRERPGSRDDLHFRKKEPHVTARAFASQMVDIARAAS